MFLSAMRSLCSLSRIQTKIDTLMIKPPPMDPWGRESSAERAEEKHQARFA